MSSVNASTNVQIGYDIEGNTGFKEMTVGEINGLAEKKKGSIDDMASTIANKFDIPEKSVKKVLTEIAGNNGKVDDGEALEYAKKEERAGQVFSGLVDFAGNGGDPADFKPSKPKPIDGDFVKKFIDGLAMVTSEDSGKGSIKINELKDQVLSLGKK